MWMACQTVDTCACSEKPTYHIQTRLQDWAVNFTVFNTTNVIPSNQKICLVTFYLKQLLYAMNIYHSRDSCSPESKTFSISGQTFSKTGQSAGLRALSRLIRFAKNVLIKIQLTLLRLTSWPCLSSCFNMSLKTFFKSSKICISALSVTRLQDWAVNFTVFNTTNVIPSNQKICLVTFYLKQLLYAMNIYHSRDSCSPESKTFSISGQTFSKTGQSAGLRALSRLIRFAKNVLIKIQLTLLRLTSWPCLSSCFNMSLKTFFKSSKICISALSVTEWTYTKP